MQPTPLFVGHSPQLSEIRRLSRVVARSTAPVLITGESGTGKEVVARLIHALSPRAHRPFITVDCGALPASLIESELFGYIKGAFTGAHNTKTGLLQLADGGTVLLDEIGELPLELQPKLLRVLQEHSIRKIGAVQTEKIDVRFLAATNQPITPDHDGFRKDLYFRLAGFLIAIPPLRERNVDIPELVREFLHQEPEPKVISPEALRRLKEHSWPGNVRELQSCCHRLQLLSEGDEITAQDVNNCLGFVRSIAIDTLNIEQLEQHAIERALELSEGEVAEAARLVGLGRTTFYRKLKQYRSARTHGQRAASAASDRA